MALTKHMVNWGDCHTAGYLTKESEMVSDDGFSPGGHYRKHFPSDGVIVIGDHHDVDFKSPSGQFMLLASDRNALAEYMRPTITGAKYNDPSGWAADSLCVGVRNANSEPRHDLLKEYCPYSLSQIRMANRTGFCKTEYEDRTKEPIRRNSRVEAKYGIYISNAINESGPVWKGTGTGRLPGHTVSDIDLRKVYQFALGRVTFAHPVAPEPELSLSHMTVQVADHRAAHELAIIQSETFDTNQSPTGESDRAVREREKLFAELANAFDAMLFEDGMAHPAERIIVDALGKEESFSWFLALVNDLAYLSIAPPVLRCLGRMVDVGTKQWRVDLVTSALATTEAEVRDAAVQVVESWAGEELLTVLESHDEAVPWIRDYINDVLADWGE